MFPIGNFVIGLECIRQYVPVRDHSFLGAVCSIDGPEAQIAYDQDDGSSDNFWLNSVHVNEQDQI